MLKKLITYTDFDGNERTEEYYFNLTKAEIVEMELTGENNSLSETLQKISDSNEGSKIIPAFKKILRQSYGQRSEDGKRFIKSEQMADEFEQTAAYSEMFFELTTDAEAAAQFIRAVVPSTISPNQSSVETTNKTPSQIAREASESILQGHNAKSTPEVPTVAQVPELPTSSSDLETDKEARRAALQAELDALN